MDVFVCIWRRGLSKGDCLNASNFDGNLKANFHLQLVFCLLKFEREFGPGKARNQAKTRRRFANIAASGSAKDLPMGRSLSIRTFEIRTISHDKGHPRFPKCRRFGGYGTVPWRVTFSCILSSHGMVKIRMVLYLWLVEMINLQGRL